MGWREKFFKTPHNNLHAEDRQPAEDRYGQEGSPESRSRLSFTVGKEETIDTAILKMQNAFQAVIAGDLSAEGLQDINQSLAIALSKHKESTDADARRFSRELETQSKGLTREIEVTLKNHAKREGDLRARNQTLLESQTTAETLTTHYNTTNVEIDKVRDSIADLEGGI